MVYFLAALTDIHRKHNNLPVAEINNDFRVSFRPADIIFNSNQAAFRYGDGRFVSFDRHVSEGRVRKSIGVASWHLDSEFAFRPVPIFFRGTGAVEFLTGFGSLQ